MAEVVTLGECMALVYPAEAVSLEVCIDLRMDIAGAESNLCIGLARLGHSALFISRVGADPLGGRIRQTLQKEGVDTRALSMDPNAPTGVFFREHFPDGQRRVYYYRKGSAASQLGVEDLREEWFTGARILHLTGITPALSASCADACQKAIEMARVRGMKISFDPNYRARLWDEQTARKALLPLVEQADFLLMGHEDARALLEVDGAEESLRAAAVLGPSVVVFKQAEEGAFALDGGEIVKVPAYPVEKVIDPVGAGDGFDAGFLAGWLRGLPMIDCLKAGARVGASAVQVLGDYHGYPTEAEVFPPERR